MILKDKEGVGPDYPNAIIFPRIESTIISELNHFPLYKSKSFLQQKYAEERLSITQISRLIFSARSTVVKHLQEFGIPIRDEDRGHKGGSATFGKRRVSYKTLDHKRELETIVQAKALREQGHSYQKIANICNRPVSPGYPCQFAIGIIPGGIPFKIPGQIRGGKPMSCKA